MRRGCISRYPREYGRAAPGERVSEAVPSPRAQKYSLLALLGVTGVAAPFMIGGAVDGAVFRAYVEKVLCPVLAVGDILVMDNLRVHKVAGIEALVQERGASIVYLPPYSPDLNPIEKCWSKLNSVLRGAKARTAEELLQAVAAALETISLADAVAWLGRCGYPVH